MNPPFNLFCAIGGSGSTFFVTALRRHFMHVGNKPDTVFRSELHLPDGDLIPQGTFEERALGFRRPVRSSPADTITQYVSFLMERPTERAAVFNTSAELHLFSSLAIGRVVFLVRHPIDAYLSWSKPERHGTVIDALGGIESDSAIRFFALRWREVAIEIRALADVGLLGGVIRYERALEDASLLGLQVLFGHFEHGRRNTGLSEGGCDHLLSVVGDSLSVWALPPC